jgi:hypothetical protein
VPTARVVRTWNVSPPILTHPNSVSVLFQIIYKAGYQAHTDVTGAFSIKVKGATMDQVRLGCTERAMRVCAW